MGGGAGTDSGGRSTLSPEVLRDIRALAVKPPAERRSPVDRVPDVESRAPLHEETHDVGLIRRDGLMERRRMIVVPLRVESIGVFTGIEEQPDDLRVAV